MKPKIITEPNVSMLNFVLLTIATLGVYPFIWMAINLEKLNEVVPAKPIKILDIVILAAMWAWSQRITTVTDVTENEAVIGVAGLICIAVLIAIPVYQFFKIVKPFVEGVDRVLLSEHKIDLRPNKFFAFAFGYFYIVYTINQVPQLIARSGALGNASVPAGDSKAGNPAQN